MTRRRRRAPLPRDAHDRARTTASTAARSPTTRIRATRGGSRSRCRRCSATWTAAGRCRARRTPATRRAPTLVPPVGAGVWVEFEAGDVSRPIWVGLLVGATTRCPTDEEGAGATPDVKITRSEEGLLLALPRRQPDDRAVGLERLQHPQDRSPAGQGHAEGRRPRSSSTRRRSSSSTNATHPGVFGDNLTTYLNQLVHAVQHAHAPGADGRDRSRSRRRRRRRR